MSGDYLLEAEVAIAAALAAGAGIMRAFGTDMAVQHKSPDQPLTEADLEADRTLMGMLRSARPGYGWLSEETADNPERLALKHVWIVDPIDGTRSFIAGKPEFAVSIALAESGVAVAGVIYNPASNELFWSVRGRGAWSRSGNQDTRLSVRNAPDGKALLLGSRSEIRRGQFELYEDWDVEGVGSTAYKMARVAAGAADGFISRGPKSEWDVCAGALMIEEAGGAVTDANGAPLKFNRADPSVSGILCATPEQHSALLAVSREQADNERKGE